MLSDPVNHSGPSCPRGLLALAVICATVGAIAAAMLGALSGLSGDARDRLVQVRQIGHAAPTNTVLVAIDEQTILKRQLPLNRSIYAEAIARLSDLGAKAIAVDVQFTEPSKDPDADIALLESIEATEVPVILGTSEAVGHGDTNVLGGRVNLEPAGAAAGHTALRMVRNKATFVGREIDGVPTFAQATANAVGRPGVSHDDTLLDPNLPADDLPTVSMEQLLTGDGLDRDAFRGKIAVIGLTIVSAAGDDRLAIVGSDRLVPGVAIQAQAIETALRGEPLRDAGAHWSYALALLIGLLAVLMASRRLGIQLAIAVGLLGLLIAGAVLAVRLGLMLDPVPAVVALLLGALGAMVVRAEAERRRRAAARATLGRFVPPGVVDELLEDDRDGRIAPQGQEATVVFCDLRGYTSLVAGLKDPAALIAILDTYLAEVTETVHRHGGTVVSFQGDGVMSAFGTPVPTAESAAQAVAAARELQARALPRVREQLAQIVDGAERLRLGVGVATGPVFAGTVGPAERREYAVVGPTTNLAARLQALTKNEDVDVILDDRTATAGTDGMLLRLGARDIRGLDRPIDVWTVVPTPAPLAHAA